MSAVRQAALILLAALIPALLTGAFHQNRPAWSEPIAPGEERLETILGWGSSVLWVDARTEKEYADDHVPNVISTFPRQLGPKKESGGLLQLNLVPIKPRSRGTT
jgi:hypothetical protein